VNKNLNKYIEYTLLKNTATEDDIKKLCSEAVRYDFLGVCVNPIYVATCKRYLAGSNVKIVTVIGFPLGECKPSIKQSEARVALADGADELDMVLCGSKLRAGEYDYVVRDIKWVVEDSDKPVKVIIESATLTDEQIIKACELSMKAGAAFVKTSTGFIGGGASEHAVTLMRKTVGDRLGVKASGGITDRATAEKMIAAGADRIGTSNGIAICK